MKQIIKNLNNLIKKTIFNLRNKTNNKFKIIFFNKDLIVKNFNNFIQNLIIKVQNKTKNNNLIKKITLKSQNKVNSNFEISVFNKFIIAFISLLFIYLFYLLIPLLYDKTSIQSNIEKKLLKEFKINFSLSSDISYYILPTPHYLIKDSKILNNDNEKIDSIAEIKNLKVFISQKNLFNKDKLSLKNVVIDNANFSLLKNNLKLLNSSSNNKFSNKEIKIKNSNIFFKDDSGEIVTIIKVLKAFFFFDNEQLLNLSRLKGEVFNIPFIFDFKKEIYSTENKRINITAKKLKFNFFNESNKENNNLIVGKNIITFFNSKIKTKYTRDDNLITFKSINSGLNNSGVNFGGKLSVTPFDLILNIDLGNYKISKLFNMNTLLSEVVKSKILLNDNISVNSTITATSNSKDQIFQNAKINLNIINGKINFDNSQLINKKIGQVKIENSNLYFINNKIILDSNIIIDIKNHKNFFSFLQTNKKTRRPIKKILVNSSYDFSTNKIEFNNIEIDNKKLNYRLLAIIEDLNNNSNNINRIRLILNRLFNAYEG
tara:strand:+ start:419 stop:2050 length:1632 start_codon:yes stop_codon:yes gene_type:complete